MELNDLDRQRLYRSSLIGAGLWSAVFLAFLLVPLRSGIPERHEFDTVRLTLTAPPAAEGLTAAPAKPADEPAAKAAKAPAAKTARITKAATAKKTAAATAKSDASAGLGIPNFSAPLTSSNRTEGQSETLDFTSTSQTAKPKTAGTASAPVAEFEGTAAQVQKPLGDGTAVTGKKAGAQASTGSTDASADTSRSLNQIAGTARTGTAASGTPGNAAGTAGNTTAMAGATGRTSTVSGLDFDGTPRKLLYPEKPSITLPANLARLVDSNRTVTVQFTVRPDGSVPGGLVFFTPSAIIPAEIRDYLKAEFARWIFEESTQDGQVRFLYSIRVE